MGLLAISKCNSKNNKIIQINGQSREESIFVSLSFEERKHRNYYMSDAYCESLSLTRGLPLHLPLTSGKCLEHRESPRAR